MNMFNKIYYFRAFYLGFIVSVACFAQDSINKNIEITLAEGAKSVPRQAPQVTIWVHGTKTAGGISQLSHACPKGLVSVDKVPRRYRLREALHVLAATDPQQFPLAHFYTFGWSGDLSFGKRKKEAGDLYLVIKKLIKQYQNSHGMNPEVTLITHSHGGNLALNLAHAMDDNDDFTLRLILLACPVQHETKDLVAHKLFSKIYSFYSSVDLFQVIDPQGLYNRQGNDKIRLEFSERCFPDHENLCQTELKVNGYGIAHVGFTWQRFMRLLPICMEQLDEWVVQDDGIGKTRIMNLELKDQKKWLFALPVNMNRVKEFFSILG